MKPFRKASPEDEVDTEFDFHVEMRTRELVARGMHPDSARIAAIARFGDLAHVSQTCKSIASQRETDMRRIEYLGELRQDARFALRQLLRNPGFTLVAVVTIALGIGATTAIFSTVRSVVLRPFAYANQDRVAIVNELWKEREGNVSAGNFIDWKTQTKSFDYFAAANYRSLNIAEGGTPERIIGALVTSEFFPVFGVKPFRGRTFTAAEDQPGHDQVAVLSHGLWQQRFAAASDIIGRVIRINSRAYTVIGIMPPGFDPVLAEEQLWIPAAFTPERLAQHDEHYLNVYGLRKTSVTAEQAQRELDAIGRVMRQRFPLQNADRGIRATTLADTIVGDYRERLFVMLGAVGFVLLIACGNVANLLLARGAARSQEMAIRTAIGAGRGRIVRQLLTESVVLAITGALVGVGIAWMTVRSLIAAAPAGIPRLNETRVDATVLLFALGAAVVSALAFGLAPALRAGRQDLAGVMKEGGRSFMAGARDSVRTALVVAEVALALTLLVGAGLLVRSAIHLQRIDPGFRIDGLLAARVALSPSVGDEAASAEQAARAFQQIVDRLEETSGVGAASVTSQAPMGPGGNSNGLIPDGRGFDPRNVIDARLRMVTPGYFRTMGIPLTSGRDFTLQETRATPHGMIISEALAKAAWPGENPIGKRVACCEGEPANPVWKTVIGVAKDVRSSGPTRDAAPEFYLPLQQLPPAAWSWNNRAMTVIVRATAGDGAVLAGAIRAAAKEADPAAPVYGVTTVEESLRQTLAPTKFNTMLLGTLGTIGLLLAVIGIYSVIAYFVSLRTHEIGVRMALGANSVDVLRLMTWQGMKPVLLGVALGALGAFWATRLLQGSLYGVSPNDPLTFASVTLALVVVAAGATLVPARRATKIDPTRALSG